MLCGVLAPGLRHLQHSKDLHGLCRGLQLGLFVDRLRPGLCSPCASGSSPTRPWRTAAALLERRGPASPVLQGKGVKPVFWQEWIRYLSAESCDSDGQIPFERKHRVEGISFMGRRRRPCLVYGQGFDGIPVLSRVLNPDSEACIPSKYKILQLKPSIWANGSEQSTCYCTETKPVDRPEAYDGMTGLGIVFLALCVAFGLASQECLGLWSWGVLSSSALREFRAVSSRHKLAQSQGAECPHQPYSSSLVEFGVWKECWCLPEVLCCSSLQQRELAILSAQAYQP